MPRQASWPEAAVARTDGRHRPRTPLNSPWQAPQPTGVTVCAKQLLRGAGTASAAAVTVAGLGRLSGVSEEYRVGDDREPGGGVDRAVDRVLNKRDTEQLNVLNDSLNPPSAAMSGRSEPRAFGRLLISIGPCWRAVAWPRG